MGAGVRVCVTGGTGYVAGHIVQRLLEKGYIVHATCRDPSSMKAVGHLLRMRNASELLRLFPADLLTPGAFHEAVAGCTYVIHTASPYVIDCQPGQEEEELIKPAVFGTENVLNAVNAAGTVQRVVITASTASVFTDAFERGEGHVFSEADWNVSATPTKFPYFYSKKLAEQRAYEMCKEAGGRWALCSINPGAIWGPPLSSRLDGESVNQCLDLLSGVMWPFVANIACGMVDVRDVARAHVAAMENPAASGRYLINARSGYLLVDAMRVLRREYPKQWVPICAGPKFGVMLFGPLLGLPRDLCSAMLGRCPVIDASKAAKDLGMTPESYILPESTISEMGAALMAKGMVPSFRLPIIPLAVVSAVLLLALVAVGLGLGLTALGVSLSF
uniref:NAD-dependent epimerase/dehydratase domain-containing protein n=1 Tax=Tetradesmus obliquus TaxID=3088 RepID=A0A383W1Q2_TETOB|eukprot:jgi/Sobl393_1/5218/SZX71587.1